MLYGIIVAMILAPFLGVPLLWVLIVGAILQGAMAYGLTRNRTILTNLMGLGIVTTSTYLILPMLVQASPDMKSLGDAVTNYSPWIIGISALLVIAHATFIGVFNIPGSTNSPTPQ